MFARAQLYKHVRTDTPTRETNFVRYAVAEPHSHAHKTGSCIARTTVPTFRSCPRHVLDNQQPPAPRFRHFGPSFCRNRGAGCQAGDLRCRAEPSMLDYRPTIANNRFRSDQINRFICICPCRFFGYSNTFGGTPSRPGLSPSVSAGQGVAGFWSTLRFPKSTRITVKTSGRDQDRRLPCRPGPFRTALYPSGPSAWPPGGGAAHARCQQHPNVGPARIRPAAMRPALLQTEFGLSLKTGAGFGVSAGPSANRIRFSGATRLRFAEGPYQRPRREGKALRPAETAARDPDLPGPTSRVLE